MRGRVEKQLEPGRSGGRRRRMSIRRRSSHCGLYSSRSCSSPQGALISRRRLLPTGDGFGDIRRRANLSSRRPRVGCLARDFARCRAIPSVSEAAARRNGTFCIEPERECRDSEVRKLKFASVAAPANFGTKRTPATLLLLVRSTGLRIRDRAALCSSPRQSTFDSNCLAALSRCRISSSQRSPQPPLAPSRDICLFS